MRLFKMFWLRLGAAAVVALAGSSATALAHVRPQTTSPNSGARLDTPPTRLVLTYDGEVDPGGTSVQVFDATGNLVATATDAVSDKRTSSVSPLSEITPGPYTVAWTTTDAMDGHIAQGFYTFVVNGGAVGIIAGQAQAEAPAADLTASLTISGGPDGASLLRVDLDNPAGVERVRLRLSRAEVGEDLLDTRPSGDGGWVLDNNEVALPGAWHAVAVIRRTNVFDDAQAAFDFSVDAASGQPAFGRARAPMQ